MIEKMFGYLYGRVMIVSVRYNNGLVFLYLTFFFYLINFLDFYSLCSHVILSVFSKEANEKHHFQILLPVMSYGEF
jgi:hypothetical protein